MLQLQSVKEATNSSVPSLAQLWAKKYVQNLADDPYKEKETEELLSEERRILVAKHLEHSLRPASLQAWFKTEQLIGQEIQRHQIDPKLIDPWQISEDTFSIYHKVIEVYAQKHPAQYTARVIGASLGKIRKKYTASDPRVLGFVSLQFHYTGRMLLEEISPQEQNEVMAYFKVIDDHLYMPLQRAYEAAASHNYDSPTLAVVQKLLPISSEISKSICQRVIELYPHYLSYTGALDTPTVKISSIRDIEMFQVYLWVSVLEGSVAAIQQELFPLCVILYPTLKVNWELVRQMINLMGKEISKRLGTEELNLFLPYFKVLREMFSPEVFPESLDEERRRARF